MTYQPTFDGIQPPERYPYVPGSKGGHGTSEAAAEDIKPLTGRLRLIALASVGRLGKATVWDSVADTGIVKDSLQPRFTELKLAKLIEPTDERRPTPAGKSSVVWQLTDAGKAALNG